MEDGEIIALYFKRDERAINETGKKYGKLCFTVAHNILHSREDSEECVNDTYYSAWNTIPPKHPNNFMAFLCRVSRNLSLKRLNYNMAQKRNPEILLSFEELEQVLPDNRINFQIRDQDIGAAISCFLQSLPNDRRNLFLRKYWFCDSIKTISEQYGYSESKVKSMLYRTRKALKEYLEKEGIAL